MPHRRKPETLSYGHGFTLIELAIVLVILGLLLGGGSMLLNPLLENNRRNETKARLKVIEDALAIYVASNSDLPCPSNPALGPGSNLNGAEGTNCGAISGSNVLVSGGVPWRRLGLSESDVLDGWGRRISYAITRDLSVTSGTPMNCRTQGFSGIIKGRLEVRGANNQIVGTALFPARDPVKAAYVLVSHGENGGGGYLPSGFLATSPTVSATEMANIKAIGVSNQAVFYFEKRTSPPDAIVGFDDIVRSRTSGQIAIAYGCATP